MGIHDRDYSRPQRSRTGLPSPRAWSVNTFIIVINVALFVLMQISPRVQAALLDWGHFSTAKACFYMDASGAIHWGLEVWRFVTFQFLHDQGSLLHIFFNMFGLWVFGGMVEQRLGRRGYAAFYLVCGIFGAVLFLILNLLGSILSINIPFLLHSDPRAPLIGASAGVFGVLIAAASFYPNAVLQLLFPPIPIRLRTFAYVYVGLAALNLFLGGNNAGGDAAHLGGAAAGFFFVRRMHLLQDFFEVLGPKKPRQTRGRPTTSARAQAAPPRPAKPSPDDERKVDEILSKVATQGLASLTDRERDILRRATETRRSS